MTDIFYDTEFIDNGYTIELISIGFCASMSSKVYYAVNADCNVTKVFDNHWLRDNVLPHLPVDPETNRFDQSVACVKPKWVIANEVRDYIRSFDNPRLWAYYGAYDHVALAQLFGPMSDLPEGIPMFTCELMQIATPDHIRLARQEITTEHDALTDAQWNRILHGIATEKAK